MALPKTHAMSRSVAMPATKAKSKQKRTLRPKGCEKCYQRAVQRLDLACKLERAEFERDGWERDYRNLVELKTIETVDGIRAMLTVMGTALERANVDIARKASVIKAYEKAWSSGQGHPE